MIGYGVDLSHHNDVSPVEWAAWRGHVDFVMVRASYGARQRDTMAATHVANARSIGAKVGLYVFVRVNEPIADHMSTLHAMADLCRIDDGDIVPALDIELDPVPPPGRPVNRSWSPLIEELAGKVAADFDNVMLYVTQADWHLLGGPAWVLRRPLWTAHWVDGAPATPGGLPATIHQHRVGPFVPNGPGGVFKGAPQYDQNRLLQPLPLVGQVVTPFERDRIDGLIALSLAEIVHPEWPAPPKDVA